MLHTIHFLECYLLTCKHFLSAIGKPDHWNKIVIAVISKSDMIKNCIHFFYVPCQIQYLFVRSIYVFRYERVKQIPIDMKLQTINSHVKCEKM